MRRRVVLVPMDFSPASERALAWAADLVATTGGSLHVLHVIPRLHPLDPFFRAGSLPSRTVAVIRERAAARLETLLRTRRIRYEFAVIEGDPATCILAEIARRRPDLVILGTHARHGAAHFLLGSVAEKVIRAAAVPVVTLREPPA